MRNSCSIKDLRGARVTEITRYVVAVTNIYCGRGIEKGQSALLPSGQLYHGSTPNSCGAWCCLELNHHELPLIQAVQSHYDQALQDGVSSTSIRSCLSVGPLFMMSNPARGRSA